MDITVYYTSWDGKNGSHELLRHAACLWLESCGRSADNIVLKDPGTYCKPYFSEPQGVEFSISHSGTCWMCAFAEHTVGLDVQKEQPCAREKMSERFFHPDENRWLKQYQYRDFFRVWAAKESYLKYTGQGLSAGMDHFSCVGPDGLLEQVEGVCQKHMQADGRCFGLSDSPIAVCLTAEKIGTIYWKKF